MATPIKMPKLGMTMAEGTVVEWPIAIGAHVDKGQIVMIIESEKAEVEIEATAAGFFRHVYVEVEETVPCGTLLAALTDTADEPFNAASFRAEHDTPEVRATPAPTAARSKPAAAAAPAADERRGRKAVAPAARALAKKLGVDVEPISGSGPGGRVTKADVEAWAAAREALVEVAPGVRLEVPSSGDGDPVLLLPGFGTDASAFARQVSVLDQLYCARGVNPRGVGLSDAPDTDRYDPSVLAADAAALAVEKPAHVLGASMGAAVAIELALAFPQRVRSLTLITPAVQVGGRLETVIDAWCRLAAEAGAATLAMTLLPWMFTGGMLADRRARDRMHRGLEAIVTRIAPAVLERQAAGLRAWSGSRLEDLARITAPTLVLVGADDILTPGGERVAELISGAKCIVIENAGHALALEAPDAVNKAIVAHLAACD